MNEGHQVLGVGQINSGEGLGEIGNEARYIAARIRKVDGRCEPWLVFEPLNLVDDRTRAVEIEGVQPVYAGEGSLGG